MAHPLEQKIAQIRSQARRLLVLYALGWTVATITLAVLLLTQADYWIRIQDPGVRLMCSLSLLAVGCWAGYRFWLVGFSRRLGDVQIAKRVERRFPALQDRLASTIEFLKQSESDGTAGSAALRRAVILETAAEVENLDCSQVFERRPTRRALAAAAAVGLVALGIALVAPNSTRIALARLMRPFGGDAWPRFNSVEFREAPTRLAAGQAFEVELLDDIGHRLPDEARIHYRYENVSGVEEETEAMHSLNGVLVARKDSVTRPFLYRAEGGDDQSMEWIRLDVVEPPRVESMQLALHPPAYSGLPSETSEKSIQALRGTRVEIAGTATKKIKSVRIHQDNGVELAVEVTADTYGFKLGADAAQPFIIDKSGSYWIVLEDLEGLQAGGDDRWDIRAVADQRPTVTIEQPAANIFVTPAGEVPLKLAAKDDLAIHDMSLRFGRSDNADVEDFVVPLYEGPEQVLPLAVGSLLAGGHLGEGRAIEHRWLLTDLGLKPGTQVTFWATAGDYLPQNGKSSVRRLTIITPQELEERLAQRQTLIFGELQRVLKMQQDARAQTKSLEIQLDQVGQLNKQDVDHAQSAELNQRQVTRTLTSPTEGIPAQIADFLADLASNRVDSPDMERHMSAIAEELARLGHQNLSTIERELTSVIKAAQAKLSEGGKVPGAKIAPDPRVNKSLTSAGENQDQVIGSLENMLSDLGQWDSYRRFARDVAQLQRDQEEIARSTRDIGGKTLGREAKDLDPQQQADLTKLANQQAGLSRRLEKTQQQMAQMSRSIKQSDPLSSATISDGLHQAEQQGISGQMRQAGEQVQKNQLGQATAQQAKIAKDLDDLMAILSNRREQELTRLVKQLREAERQMARLRSQQEGLRKQMRALADDPKPTAEQKRQLERLTREQKQLHEDASRLSRKLERLQADQAARVAAGAAGKMAGAGSASEKGDAAGAAEQSEKVEEDLEAAQQKLAERRRQAEADLAREQVARMRDSLISLRDRQKKMIAETDRMEKLRAAEGRLTRSQANTVHDLARQQKSLETETALLAEKLAVTEVINLALAGAAKHMTRAAEMLSLQHTGATTQQAQEAARARLDQLLAAFENKAKPQEGQDEGGAGGGSGSGSKAGADAEQVLTQLKLLRILQEDLNGRFRALTEGDAKNGEPQELADIASEQGQLAGLALKLAEPPDVNPEDDPEKLPDVRKEATPDDVVPPGEVRGADVPGSEPLDDRPQPNLQEQR